VGGVTPQWRGRVSVINYRTNVGWWETDGVEGKVSRADGGDTARREDALLRVN
jgi:hypothetical protein